MNLPPITSKPPYTEADLIDYARGYARQIADKLEHLADDWANSGSYQRADALRDAAEGVRSDAELQQPVQQAGAPQ